MDQSDQSLPNDVQAQPVSPLLASVRAMISAAVFGAIGWFVGKKLGAGGNDERSQMAQSAAKWGMGGFWALLAAYSSLKVTDQRDQVIMAQEKANATLPVQAPVQVVVAKDREPSTQVHGVKTDGIALNSAPEASLRK